MTIIRTHTTGATRDNEEGKLDYEGFLSPQVLEEFAKYMNQHRVQADGALRDSDNWQKGMPREWYIKSLWRHFMDLWMIHRGISRIDPKDGHEITVKEAGCAIIFNVQGYMYTFLKND